MKTLLLIDANSLIYRCFFALPPFTTKEGKASGALYGLSTVLMKIFREQSFDFVIAFFDRPEPTFREKIYKEYKAHRPPTPNELIEQIKEAHELFNQFGIKTFEAPSFEADDLIGTAVEKFKNLPDLKIIIFTGDLDTLQLIDNHKITVETFKKGVSNITIYNEEAVKNRFGILPEQIIDYKGLVGDPSDNIPGVKGIGPKTAASIIQKYGSLENFLETGDKEKSYLKIFENKEIARLSKNLATIRRDAPLEITNLDELKYQKPPTEKLAVYLEKLGFKSLVDRMNKLF